MIPFQITFKNVHESDAVWMAVQERAEKLERFFDRIVRCEVILSCPHKHRHADRLFHVQINISMPRENIFINRSGPKNEAHRDIYVAIRDAFDAAERVLQHRVDILRGDTKHKNLQKTAVSV